MRRGEVEKALGEPVFHAGPGEVEERVNGTMREWGGSMALYVRNYGGRFCSRIAGESGFLAKEKFWVYYDPEGRATMAYRELHLGSDSQKQWIDFENRTLSQQIPDRPDVYWKAASSSEG
jgi:hypothetical protein